MSEPFGQDSGDVGSEENPDPEEDSDWSRVGHVREPSDHPADEQGEDPEDISEICVQAVAVTDRLEEVNDENEQVLVEQESSTSLKTVSSHPEEDETAFLSSSLVKGDSFDQDEQMAAPESENGVIQQACIESDQQLLGVGLAGSVPEENTFLDVSVNSSHSLPLKSNATGGFNADEYISDNNAPNTVSGDVQVEVSSGVDAPEDDIMIDQYELSAEEGAVLLSESGRLSEFEEESPVIESQRVISDSSIDGERDSQVPECDRNEEEMLPQAANSTMSASIQTDQCEIEHIQVNSVQECEGNQISQMEEEEVNSHAHSERVVKNNISETITVSPNSHPHSRTSPSEDQSDKQNNSVSAEIESSIDTQEVIKNSSSPSLSPSHLNSKFEHSNGSSPTHEMLSTIADSAALPVTITSPNSSDVQMTSDMPTVSSSGPVTVCPSSSTVTPSSNPRTQSTSDDTPFTHTAASSTECSLKPTELPVNNHVTNAAKQESVDKDSHNASLSKQSFHANVLGQEAAMQKECEPSYSGHSKEKGKMMSPEDYYQKQLAFALSNDDDDDELDDIMSELDAELLSRSSGSSPQRSRLGQNSLQFSNSSHTNVSQNRNDKTRMANGIVVDSEFRQLQEHNRQLLEQLKIRDAEIEKLCVERDSNKSELTKVRVESQEALAKVSSSHNADDLYLPQIKELENTIVQQQKEIQATKDKLISHDTAAKRAVTTLQNELKSRVDQVTKQYEEAVKEKDSMVVMFASSESRVMDSKKAMEKSEARLKDAMREKESLISTLKAAKYDKLKAVNSLEQKCSELGSIQREMEKLKEALSSSDYRIKWFQNKLKDELESHKETKSNLDKTSSKLKETKEETEIIRRECQAIVKTYQESEEIKSNSLDKELKMKESQLRHQMQEWNDNEEIHQRTKKELETLKGQHKEAVFQLSSLKEKVQSLEVSVAEKGSTITQSNELLNKQKADITNFTSKLREKQNLDDDFNRAQEMIKALDKDVSELKIGNRDLQKDMDSCRERESKMLALQSELSRTNACLRSENTTLSNKVTNQTADIERLKMEIQELETTVKHLTDSVEDEKKNNVKVLAKLKGSLEEKTKESCDFKQKWEDEIDSNKTLKRRHANNVKDLTRQLQQAKRRLEVLEGSRKDSSGSMGSRTNSNGSLNSMVDNNQGSQNAQSGTSGASSVTSPEFPVITEQVEIDKQVLIERIVRLQKSHARKNEKLEFLGEHIQQLLEEIKKKTKIIQSYVMREEAGTLSSEDMDANKGRVNEAYKAEAQKEMKSLLSRKGGIMASVYSLHQQDGNMTLELSLQINKKLQAVLEDTLLKNITLKENLDTLGEEIARLSQVNRKLQLHLQDLSNTNKH